MKSDILLSVGIDIGTTTTHLILSKISICVEGGFGVVPKAKITDKKIIYKSPVYFTPLSADGGIDLDGVAKIINTEYKKAGVTPDMLNSGAVIITGESSKKYNADEVLHKISSSSGSFVAAQAGARLESILSGRGAGADIISEQNATLVANIDIGGGTTNISFFENGKCVDDCCLNIGGRLVKFEGENVIVSPTVEPLYRECDSIDELCEKMADCIFRAVMGGEVEKYLITDRLPKKYSNPKIITFSGGVGECIYNESNDEYSDIGIMLARAVKKRFCKFDGEIARVENPIRATVIGAGNFSLEVSGSTIQYADKLELPLKNLECITDLSQIGECETPCAICPETEKSPDFNFINSLALDIAKTCENMIKSGVPVVVITKYDISKALGICLRRYLPKDYPFICADGIDCSPGDYIDIGKSIANGRAVPVVVKTLVFGG